MRLSPGVPELVASEDHAYVAMAGAELTLLDAATRATLSVVPLGTGAHVGFLGPRLLSLLPGEGRTLVSAYALPSLELVAQLELDGRLVPLAFTSSRALVTTESLEHPRVVGVTTKIIVDPIPMREPLVLGTTAPEERLLVASRVREAQLECWDPLMRRALFRLNLPLMPRAHAAGFAARRRLLWIASAGQEGVLEVYRFSDGRLQARVDLGAPIVSATGHPESPRLVVATRTGDAAVATRRWR
jgi:hypothetical protein